MNDALYTMYKSIHQILIRAEKYPELFDDLEGEIFIEGRKVSLEAIELAYPHFLAQYKRECNMQESFSQEKIDFICEQIGDWYLKWKRGICNEDLTHRLGFAKEELKTMICGEQMNEESKGIMLDEASFRCLVSGGVVHSGKIRIALADIGFSSMYKAIWDAEAGIAVIPKNFHEE